MKAEIFTVGVGLLFLGGVLWFVRRLGWVHLAVKARKVLLIEANRTGDEQRAKRLENEIYVFQRRLPVYSRMLSIVGFLLLVFAIVLHFFQ